MTTTRRRVVGIALITAVAVMGDAMLFIVLPLYWQDFGMTALWQVGILLSINRFIRLPITPLVGLFYKRYQMRTGVFIAVVLAVITTASYGIVNQFWLLLVMRALWGVAWSFLRLGGFLTVIDVTSDSNRGQFVGVYNGLWGLGGLAGMLAGGILVDQTSVTFVTMLFAIIALITIPFVWYLVPASKNEEQEEKINQTVTKPWLTPYIQMVLATGIALGFIVSGLFASTLSPLIERSHVTEWSFSHITIGAATLAGFVQAIRWGWDPFLAPLLGKMLDSLQSLHRVILIPLIGGGVLFLLLGSVQSIIWLLITLLLFQLISTMFTTTTDTLATSAASRSDHVKVMTAHTLAVDVGAALGPLASFVLLEFYSLSAVYYVAGSLMLLLGVGWIFFKRVEI